jgi:hypothetical protein
MVDYLQEQLERGTKFEVMTHSDGWKLIEAYYTNLMADLANRIFTGDGDVSVFQHEVDEVRGLRKLIASISRDVDVLHEQSKAAAD